MYKAAIIGVTGYTGMELLRLLAVHDDIRLVLATSRAEAGRTIADLYPHLAEAPFESLVICEPDAEQIADTCDIAFLGVPHGAAMDMAGELYDRGVKVVDLSADFRLHDKDVYAEWYGLEHRRPELLDKAAFGLIELYRDDVARAQLVANPGCYPTSVILGLNPALRGGFIETDGIVIDAKSGATGAGVKPNRATLYCEVSDSFRAYGLPKHRHTPEIEQEVSAICGSDVTLSFNTHLLPMNRGILSTIYTNLKPRADMEEVRAAYEEAYASEEWVRVLPEGKLPETRWVRGSMFVDMQIVHDPRTNRLIIVSAIDNLCRGASGQALANANIMLGLPENSGLKNAPIVP